MPINRIYILLYDYIRTNGAAVLALAFELQRLQNSDYCSHAAVARRTQVLRDEITDLQILHRGP